MKYVLIILLALAALLFSTELDLPILPPDDPRREEYKPAEIPLPPPEIEEPVPPPVFFGEVMPESESIVYVLDFSQSMSAVQERVNYNTTKNRWQVVQREATRSISALAESIRFGVVVFGTAKGACGVTMWRNQLSKDKAGALAFIQSFTGVSYNGGATPTAPAVLMALTLEPQTIILLTDGQPSQCGIGIGQPAWLTHRKRIQADNNKPVPIQVFGIGLPTDYARQFCRGVASDSTGTFVEIR